jgi:hypothetical protein
MSIESIRAVILFAIGDPAFRAELIERREEALAPFELSLDDVMLLETVQFSASGTTFSDGELLERLLGSAAGNGFPGISGPGWFGMP